MEISKVNRFVAVLIDGIIAYIPSIIITLILPKIAFIGTVIYLVLFLLRDSLFGDQSIGKKIMKYRVVTEEGASLKGNHGASAMRNLPTIFLIDYIMVLLDKPKFGDLWAKTKVVAE